MSPIKEIPFGSFVSWSPLAQTKTLLAVGRTDCSGFSLNFIDIDVTDMSRRAYSVTSSTNFSDGSQMTALQWRLTMQEESSGLICVGTSSGHAQFWVTRQESPEQEKFLVSSCLSNDNPVTCIEFNPVVSPTLLACGHSDGSLNIINLEHTDSPDSCEVGPDPLKTHGSKPVSATAWNENVPHILASTCLNGTTAIWNLKQRKAAIRFRDPAGRQKTSSVAWIPNQATQIIVAYDDDANPSLQMWDLRNAAYPFKEFPGHSRGILAIRVSPVDPSLFLTCGRDNRNVCWTLSASADPTVYSEMSTTEWQTQIRWSPSLPGLYASISNIDGVIIDSVHERRNIGTKYIPEWFKKPAGATFGFGGKLTVFNTQLNSVVRVDIVPTTETDMIAQADEFETTLMTNDYLGYCEKKIRETNDDYERLTWQVVETLFYPPEARASVIVNQLGFKTDAIERSIEQFLGRKPGQIFSELPNESCLLQQNQSELARAAGGAQEQQDFTYDKQMAYRQQSLCTYGTVDAENFFNTLGDQANESMNEEQQKEDMKKEKETKESFVKDGRVYENAAHHETGYHREFSELNSVHKLSDNLIKTSFLVGQIQTTAELCMETNRWSDALLLAATSGNSVLWENIKKRYIMHRSYDKLLQMISCVISQQWTKLIDLADLTRWEETLAVLASYVPADLYPVLSEKLGYRLETEMFDIRAAVICYLTAGSFRKTTQIWSSLAVSNSRGKSLQKTLQDLVEMLTILKKATNFQEDDSLFNQKVSQYAEILANSGRLVASMKFLCLVGQNDVSPATSTNILRHRIYNSSPEAMLRAGVSPPAHLPFNTLNVVSTNDAFKNSAGASFQLGKAGAPQTLDNKPKLYHHSSLQNAYQQQQQTSWSRKPPSSISTYDLRDHRPNSYAGAPPPPQQHYLSNIESNVPVTNYFSGSRSYNASNYHDYPQHQSTNATPNVTAMPPPPMASYSSEQIHSLSKQQHNKTQFGGGQYSPAAASNTQFIRSVSPNVNSSNFPMSSSVTPALIPRPLSSSDNSLMLNQNPSFSHTPMTSGTQLPAPPLAMPNTSNTATSLLPPSNHHSMPNTPVNSFNNTKTTTGFNSTAGKSFVYNPPCQPSYPPTMSSVGSENLAGSNVLKNNSASITGANSYTGSDQGSTNATMSPIPYKSTAPIAAVSRMPPGMPVPWPIPTGTQQVGSNTHSTATANQKIHAILNTPTSEGIPMNASDLNYVQTVLFNAVDHQVQQFPQNIKKNEDLVAKLKELLTQLQNGALSKTTQNEVIQFCKVLEIGDYNGATQMQTQLIRTSWTKENRNWLTALKRLLIK